MKKCESCERNLQLKNEKKNITVSHTICSSGTETEIDDTLSLCRKEIPNIKYIADTSTELALLITFHPSKSIRTPETSSLQHAFPMQMYGERPSGKTA